MALVEEMQECGIMINQSHPIAAVLVHVGDVPAAARWYQQALKGTVVTPAGLDDIAMLDVAGVIIELVSADEKVASGPAGSVVYWRVLSVHAALGHLVEVGAVLYRGPLAIEAGEVMLQVRDPWGNCIGIRGPR